MSHFPVYSTAMGRLLAKGSRIVRKADSPVQVFLIQQGIWDTPLESMPLACGYLKATALADACIRDAMELTIHNFRGGVTLREMANRIFEHGAPDILAISVFGWNYRSAGSLAETFKQLNPDGWVIFGGTHVSHQAERTFRMYPDVDVVVNDEGEFAFRDLLRAYLAGTRTDRLGGIPGLSYQEAGQVRTTLARPRIECLDDIPSPFLTGAIPMTDSQGQFLYDVALMETNRGCPYKCAFCYWGGAVGQKVRAFSRERLRQELEFFAKLRVHTIVVCDANFAILREDKTFIDDLIDIRDRYGFPRALETSWAKNKSNTFYDIVRMMKESGLRSSFTLALQTLDDTALTLMNRRNMKVNRWEELVEWLHAEGLDCYAELIWGAPGETVESFMEGYDRLSRHVSRIAVYSMLLLPNTDYTDKKKELGLITVRGDDDDFEYILAADTFTFEENQQVQRFQFWARIVAENAILRHTWIVLRELTHLTQSRALLDLDNWITQTADPAAEPLREARNTGDVTGALGYLHTDPAAKQLLRQWWRESLSPQLAPESRSLADEAFRYDILTLPVVHGQSNEPAPRELPTVGVRGETYYLHQGVEMAYDVPAITAALHAGEPPDLTARPTRSDLYYRTGSEGSLATTSHETVMHFLGMNRTEASSLAGIDVESWDQLLQSADGTRPPADQSCGVVA